MQLAEKKQTEGKKKMVQTAVFVDSLQKNAVVLQTSFFFPNYHRCGLSKTRSFHDKRTS